MWILNVEVKTATVVIENYISSFQWLNSLVVFANHPYYFHKKPSDYLVFVSKNRIRVFFNSLELFYKNFI